MKQILNFVLVLFLGCMINTARAQNQWSSDYVFFGNGGKLTYTPDEEGNIIPDFSHVGYQYGDESIPDVPVAVEVSPVDGDDGATIQAAIESLYVLEPDANGFRGAVLLKSGEYQVEGQISITQSGIVLKGEGNDDQGTVIWATGTSKRSLLVAGNNSSLQIQSSTGVDVAETFVPVGRQHLVVENAAGFQAGDLIAIYRPGTQEWISAIKMDQISPGTPGDPTQQWTPGSYSFYFERTLTAISGDTLFFRNPIVMALDENFGGGMVYKATFDRIENVGVENMAFKSEYASETDEDHSWTAVEYNSVQNGWVRDVKSWYFAYACVSVKRNAKLISVLNCGSYEPKSIITGARRYSFYCEGQLNLFKNCEATEGRHDYVLGSRVCGPNVFTQSTASNAYADIGPHHRWAMGALFDQITTDNQINVQDRDDMGSGHGWAGANQVFWNCQGSGSICQSPWASAKNYNFGFIGAKLPGARPNRPDGVWVGHNETGIFPESLYETQLDQRLNGTIVFSALSALEQLNDSVFLMRFNLPTNASTVVSDNFEIAGTAGINDQPFAVEVHDNQTVKIIFSDLGILPALSTIKIVANDILSEDGLSLTGLKTSSFIVPDERPVVEGVEIVTNNEAGGFGVAKSTKEGYVYLIRMGEVLNSLADVDNSLNNAAAARSEVSQPGSSVPIYTVGLQGGVYRYYASDTDGRISEPDDVVVIINATGPVTSIDNMQEIKINWHVSNGKLTLHPENLGERYDFHLFDISGRTIIQQSNITGVFSATLPHIKNSPLILRIVNADGVATAKFFY